MLFYHLYFGSLSVQERYISVGILVGSSQCEPYLFFSEASSTRVCPMVHPICPEVDLYSDQSLSSSVIFQGVNFREISPTFSHCYRAVDGDSALVFASFPFTPFCPPSELRVIYFKYSSQIVSPPPLGQQLSL